MKKLIAVALLAGFVTVSANAQAPAQGEKKMSKKGEMMEKKAEEKKPDLH